MSRKYRIAYTRKWRNAGSFMVMYFIFHWRTNNVQRICIWWRVTHSGFIRPLLRDVRFISLYCLPVHWDDLVISCRQFGEHEAWTDYHRSTNTPVGTQRSLLTRPHGYRVTVPAPLHNTRTNNFITVLLHYYHACCRCCIGPEIRLQTSKLTFWIAFWTE